MGIIFCTVDVFVSGEVISKGDEKRGSTLGGGCLVHESVDTPKVLEIQSVDWLSGGVGFGSKV